MSKIQEQFKNFVIFSFDSIDTIINDEGIEKKKLNFNGVQWDKIDETSINWSHSAYAVITGEKSKITVIDIDDTDYYNNLMSKYPVLKEVFTVKTKNGFHLYFNYDENIKSRNNGFINTEKVDIKNNGAICIIPPTKYKLVGGSTFQYKFMGGSLLNIPTEFLSEFKQFNKKSKSKSKQENNDNENSIKYNEIEQLLKTLDVEIINNYENWLNVGFICKNELGDKGFNLWDKWSKQNKKYICSEMKNKFDSFSSDGTLTINTLKMYSNKNLNEFDILINFTTGDNADYFKKLYSNKFIFNNDKLYYFNGVYWKEDDKKFSYLNNFIDEEYFFIIYSMFQKYEIEIMKKKEQNKDIFKMLDSIKKEIRKLKNYKARVNFIDDIICKITNNNIKWNETTNYYTFENKIYDIEKGAFIKPKPEFFINMSCGWKYDDNYNKKLVVELDEFINTIHTNKDIKKLYLECMSTGLSAQTLEKFIIANGKGGNGKGVINELALLTFGNYGYILPSNILLNPLKTGSNPELANCNFKRFVLVREPDDNYKLNCATIKEITGGNKINARFNHSNDTDTNLNLTLIMECNEKPKLSEVNDAIRRRILDIPFNSSFVESHIYNKLDEDEKSNIFVGDVYFKSNEFKEKYKQALFELLIVHYKAFFKNKSQLTIPNIIFDRNNNYMADSDEIFNMVDEVLIKTNDKKDVIKLKELYEILKGNDIFINMSKEKKRNFNYKNFCSKLENNIFFKKFVGDDIHKVKVLKCYKMKDMDDDGEYNLNSGLDN